MTDKPNEKCYWNYTSESDYEVRFRCDSFAIAMNELDYKYCPYCGGKLPE